MQNLSSSDLVLQGLIKLPYDKIGGSQIGGLTLFDMDGHGPANRRNFLCVGNSKRWPFHIWELTNPTPGLTVASAPTAQVVNDWGPIDPTNKMGLGSGLSLVGGTGLTFDKDIPGAWLNCGDWYQDDWQNLPCVCYFAFDFTAGKVVLEKFYRAPIAINANSMKGWIQHAPPSVRTITGMDFIGGCGLGSRASATTSAHGPILNCFFNPAAMASGSTMHAHRLEFWKYMSYSSPAIQGFTYSNWISTPPSDAEFVRVIAGNEKWSSRNPPGSWMNNTILQYKDFGGKDGCFFQAPGRNLIGQARWIEAGSKGGLLFTFCWHRGGCWYGYENDHSGLFLNGNLDPGAAQWNNALQSLIGNTGHQGRMWDKQFSGGGGHAEDSVAGYGFVSLDKLLANAQLVASGNYPTADQLEIQPYEQGRLDSLGGSVPLDYNVPQASNPAGSDMEWDQGNSLLYMGREAVYQAQGAILVWTIPGA